MAVFTVEADGQPICTFAADDVEQAGQMMAYEKEEWVEIGAIPEGAAVSVRQANLGEAMFWKETIAQAVEQGAAEDIEEAEDSIVAFHVEVDGMDDEDIDEED